VTIAPRRQEYDESMTTRITVSLPTALVDAANEAVKAGRAASVSAYVAEAMAEKAERGSLEDFLAGWRAQVGPPTPEETEWAERALGIKPKPAR
jgi:Arc/MetJ-type ribon-helix-helix transcriptional regulator